MTPFFSILVPCCNVAPYVRECLTSVKEQSFADWECLVVVETSSDDTEAIVYEVVGNDRRFQIFTQPRSGSPSVLRNIGINHAQGEYVLFLDGEDAIAEDALQQLHDKIAARPNADIYVGGIKTYGDNGDFLGSSDSFSSYASSQELSGPAATLFLFHPGGVFQVQSHGSAEYLPA